MRGFEGADGRALAVVDTAAIARNFSLFRALGGRTLAVVKANAYGHGISLAVPALVLAGCDFFAVACLGEALAVRRLAPAADILILGYTPPEKAPILHRHGLTQTVFSEEYAMALCASAREGPVAAHLKIDGGMCRLGLSARALGAARRILRAPNLRVWGLFTHFPVAESDSEATRAALADFLALRDALPQGLFAHAAATAAALCLPEAILDGARVGLGLYGYASCPSVGLCPALRLMAPLVQIREVPCGTPVGYGGDFRAARRSRIGVLPVGYADGLCRRAQGFFVTVLHGGMRYSVPIVGRVCMDQIMVDLTDTPAKTGDTVCIFENAAALADHCGTIAYEVLSTLSGRVARRERRA